MTLPGPWVCPAIQLLRSWPHYPARRASWTWPEFALQTARSAYTLAVAASDSMRRAPGTPVLVIKTGLAEPDIASALSAFFTRKSNCVRVTFENSKESPWRNSTLACVLNTPTFGAGIQLTPNARINDGLLDFAFLEELRFGELLRVLPRLAIHGTLDLPKLQTMQIHKVRLETKSIAYFQGDGEILGPTPVEIEVVPNAVQFLAPKCSGT